jgi:hypothetical protein
MGLTHGQWVKLGKILGLPTSYQLSEKTKAPQTQRVTGRLADQPSPESCSLLPYRVG